METNWLEFWYAAAASEFGYVIAVSDPNAAKQALYRARAKSGDPMLEGLEIWTSPHLPQEELWIVRTPDAARDRRRT